MGDPLAVILYLDTSALIKLVRDEPGSEAARDLWAASVLSVASALAYAEGRAALAAMRRAGRLSTGELESTVRALDGCWAEIETIALTPELARLAGALAQRHGLRGGDAVHLASASLLREEDVVVATWDRALAGAATDAGLRVSPVPA